MSDVASLRDPIFACAGEMAERCASFDWSSTVLGASQDWPRSLRTVVAMVLRNAFPMIVTWGDDFVMIYNDAYIATLGSKHPDALGSHLFEQFSEIWSVIGPAQTAVLHGGATHFDEDVPFVLERRGAPEETYYTFSWSHVPPDEPDAGPGGVLTVLSERTAEVVGARRLSLLNRLNARTQGLTDPHEALRACGEVLTEAPTELVSGTVLRPGDDGRLVVDLDLAAAFPGAQTTKATIPAEARRCWADGEMVVVPDPAAPRVALPLRARDRLAGVLVLDPHLLRPLDEDHRTWLGLVGEQVSQALAAATARSDELARLAALARLDAAKSDFLSNISHEFRTPLTLVLGPLEDALAEPDVHLSRSQVEVMHRSGRRLLRLVDSLMNAARMDVAGAGAAGDGVLQPVDLTSLTRDLVLAFEPAAVQAGLILASHFEETGVVGSDPALWECVVINLVANAVKYTPAGLVEVSLGVDDDRVVLRVSDTGVGIPEAEHERVFERFHRVLGPDAVSVEGSGLGLSLVAAATRALGGSIDVASRPSGGSTFTVSLPVSPVPADEAAVPRTAADAQVRARDLVADLTGASTGPTSPGSAQDAAPDRSAPAGLPTVLVVDDNHDMRQRVAEVLAPLGRVVACRDGLEAMEVVAELGSADSSDARRIDLVVTDVSMPRLDGLGLVERLRADPRHAGVPVVVLSARAGPEAAASALELGADDYVVKPFTSTDLLARCRSTLALTRMRSDRSSAAARDAVLAGVSHEMQTPLSVIMTALEVIATPETDAVTRSEAAGRAAARVRVLDRLVRQFLDWSRITAGSPIVPLRTPVVLGDLLGTVLLEHRRTEVVGAGVGTTHLVSCDLRRTEQILHTLLGNATHAAETQVELEVLEDRGPDGELRGFDVVVRHDGPAADERVLRGLVTPAPTNGTPSTGAIGLAVSRAAARAQGGDLTLGSSDQHGCVFVLRLVSGD